ncbi:MAG TPA: FIST N-terminal domain-containing protein [Acidimicrobiales bacterium]|nr:FIST N-terminal domain-containing protein [Acidimicrobiales bacterium]
MGAAVAGDDAKLLLVFCSDDYDVPVLLDAIRGGAPGVPLIGCSTAGEIGVDGAGDQSVVVLALGGPGFSVATAWADGSDGDLRRAAEEVSACVAEVESRANQVLLLLSDGLGGDQQEIVRGAYAVLGAQVPLVGGCAGDGLKMTGTLQFHDGDVRSGAVVAAAISSDGPIGIGVRHGWRRVGEPLLVSESESNRVYLLNGEPALDVYLRCLGAPAEAHTDAAAFTHFAMTHPLGLSRRSGEEVRYVAEADFERRSLVCIAEVPKGGLAWFMEGDEHSVLEASDEACGDALATLGGAPPLGFVAFDCIARRGVLGDDGIATEVERIASHANGAPVAGFYTYGEIARTRGVSGFHNQTLVVLALA